MSTLISLLVTFYIIQVGVVIGLLLFQFFIIGSAECDIRNYWVIKTKKDMLNNLYPFYYVKFGYDKIMDGWRQLK